MNSIISKIIRGSRPATLSVTLISTTIGIIAAWNMKLFSKFSTGTLLLYIILITIAGILLQSGVNLVNNYFEEEVSDEVKKERTVKAFGFYRTKDEVLLFSTGIVFFLITAVIGIYLALKSGRELFIVEILGLAAAYGYDGKPLSYKKLGLGAVMSFVMMGPLLTYASFYVFSGKYSSYPILLSFTFGMFIPAILLANEIRDYEEDMRNNAGTLTCRIGLERGIKLYYGLSVLAYFNIIMLASEGLLPNMVFITFLSGFQMIKCRKYVSENKHKLVPETAKLHFQFGVLLGLAIIVSKIFKLL